MKTVNHLGTDPIGKLVPRIAFPSMLAQFVSVLYSIVDRMYIGHIASVGDLALAGVGVCGPILTMIGAFSSLIGVGGAPLLGIRLGEKNEKEASRILANAFLMLVSLSLGLTAAALFFTRPMLMRIGIVFPNRICSTYRQLAIWESTVAIAAPRTPRCRTKINTGSSSRFRMAPSRTDFIPSLAKPWQITNWFRPVDKSANTEPET